MDHEKHMYFEKDFYMKSLEIVFEKWNRKYSQKRPNFKKVIEKWCSKKSKDLCARGEFLLKELDQHAESIQSSFSKILSGVERNVLKAKIKRARQTTM